MKKISVMTLHYINNYGSVLQTVATQEFFKKLGWDACVVDNCVIDCSGRQLCA